MILKQLPITLKDPVRGLSSIGEGKNTSSREQGPSKQIIMYTYISMYADLNLITLNAIQLTYIVNCNEASFSDFKEENYLKHK